jgi:hypothetical protein
MHEYLLLPVHMTLFHSMLQVIILERTILLKIVQNWPILSTEYGQNKTILK